MAIAMGTPLVGAAAEPLIDAIDKTDFPVVRNMDGVTSAVLSYEGTGPMRGHYVLFDRDDARQQYTCFATNFRIDHATELSESCAW
jgi:hypothetical protein